MLSVTVLLSITAAPLISTNGCPWNQTARSWFSTCGEFTLQESQGRLSLYLNKSALWNVAVDVAKLILRRDGMLRKIVEKTIVSCNGVLFLPQLNSVVWVCGDVRDQSPRHFFWACRCASCDSLHSAQVEHVPSRTGCNGCYSRVKKVHLATRSSNRPEETKFSSKKKERNMQKPAPPPLPTHSCHPGAYLVVEGVATGYVSEYRTIAGWAVQTEGGIVWVDSHRSAPPTAKSLPFIQHPDVWLLFITQDNINSRLNKLGRFLVLFFLNSNPQRASRHRLSSFTLPLHLSLRESVHIA